jgi:hypothetical protein
MRKCTFFLALILILAFQVGTLTGAQADVVGRLTQVDGRVDLLKGGKLPATPVKVNDGVQLGDVVRTKSQSKAQITFIDNSTLTIAPESRVGIEAYMFDAAQNKRNAVVQLFQGLVHVVVNKVMKSAEPDFVVKTQTAVMGVRGTDFGVRLHPNSSDVLNFEGLLQVGNILPEVSQLFQRAFKVAYSFGPGPGQHWVHLKAMQGTTVGRGLPPSAVFAITPAMRNSFMQQVVNLSSGKGQGASGGGTASAVAGAAGSILPGESGGTGSKFIGLDQPGTAGVNPVNPTLPTSPITVVTTPTVIPTVTTVTPPPPPPPPPKPPLPPVPPR